MNLCYASGGPAWLFSLALGCGIAALGCLVLTYAGSPMAAGPGGRAALRRRLVLPAAGMGLGVAGGLPLVDLVALYAPVLLVVGVLLSAGPIATAGGRTPPRATAVALLALTGTVALGALAAMVLQGGPC